ncbi:MAG: RluA family pseudouridine synthase [Vicinamibacterales bacterium]
MPLRTIIANRGHAGSRVDRVLADQLADVRQATRTQIQTWIREGTVTVNGRPPRKPSSRVGIGDIIRVDLPADAASARRVMEAEPAPTVRVLYEDEHLLAVDKPPGMVAHPTYRHPTGTLMNGLLWHARRWPPPQRPSLVGRLDRLTSGLVLVARTRALHASLQRALASSASRKEYLAIVYGRVARAHGTIALRLHRDDRDRRRVVASTLRGQLSVTEFERLARSGSPHVGLALLRCRLVTGRMHQIRVHLAARGWPLVGDPIYGEPRWSQVVDPVLARALASFPRQALHAWRMTFPHPVTGADVRLEAPVPDDLSWLMTVGGLTTPADASRE